MSRVYKLIIVSSTIKILRALSCNKMWSCFIVVLILCAFSNLEAIDFPPDLPRCYRNDPNINECFLKATETVRPKLKFGIKELGIPAIDEYIVPLVVFEQGSKALNFKMTLTNLTIKGLDTYKFTKFDFDPKTLRFDLINEFGPLITASNCLFEGHLLLTNLNGTGILLLNTGNSVFTTKIIGKLENRNGADYYKATNISVTTPGKFGGKARFEDFMGVHENIVKAINKVLEENGDDLFTEVLPIFINFVEDFVASIYNEVFEKFPYDILLPASS